MNTSNRSNPVVVVPVHRSSPTVDEKFSLRRCGKVLCSHPIRIIHPVGLNLDPYLTLIPNALGIAVSPEWMSSVESYNRMILNPDFYALFHEFSHILIHEPDALVLSDQLLSWCAHSIDYIGAPWFEGYSAATSESELLGVGNSGFSLIRVSAMQRVLSSNFRWMSYSCIAKEVLKRLLGRKGSFPLASLIKLCGGAGKLRGAHLVTTENCDSFISTRFKLADPGFRVASVATALGFSWEVNPSVCQRLNRGCLPFGIHAWARYDRNFVVSLISD